MRSHELSSTPITIVEGLDAMAGVAIDQVILDGLVDGAGMRAHFRTLAEIAFDGPKSLAHDTMEGFRTGLVTDARFVDREGNRYDLRPRPEAILRGTANHTEEERQAVLDQMEFFTSVIFTEKRDSPLSLKTMEVILELAGVEYSHAQFSGFRTFIQIDPRFMHTNTGIIFRPKRAATEPAPEPPAKAPPAKPPVPKEQPQEKSPPPPATKQPTLDEKLTAAFSLPEGERWTRGHGRPESPGKRKKRRR
jgi:hypothetical protein